MTAASDLRREAARLVEALGARRLRMTTAESCTGGMIAAAMTEVPGASAVFDRAYVTYSNAAKTQMLGVPAAVIAAEGAVSETVARLMAAGGLAASGADVCVAVTGVAGPGGGSAAKPVGLVHLALAGRDRTIHRVERFGDLGRDAIRAASVRSAFALMQVWLRPDADP